ncbi:MAG: cell division protein FtsQ/DivIB [Xanthomonadaceae bacterium]|jgi:cell division protein FtsQ|nr:cell division protein FtsQ/DivIB [Xanthomonadaceae bacterium]
MSAMLRIFVWILALALVALPVVAVLNGWVGEERWPLSRLRVTGEFERVTPEQVRTAVIPYAKRGFFAVSLQDVQDAVEHVPWVSRAQVRKHWPNVLEIHVEEHRPFARWGDDRMLSVHGEFYPIPPELADLRLPRLSGPDDRVMDVVKLYNQSRALLAPIGLSVIGVDIDARGSYALTLSNGAEVVIGRNDPQARLNRFAHVLPQLLTPRSRVVARADLRYTNGFTMTWKQAPAPSLFPAPLDSAPQTQRERI